MSATRERHVATRRLVRASDGAALARRVEIARSFGSRLLGLMGRTHLEEGEALWLEPCSSIHMAFVRFPIDVLFLDRSGYVLAVFHDVKPWIGLAWCRGASATVELAAGSAALSGVIPGDRLELIRSAGACPPPPFAGRGAP